VPGVVLAAAYLLWLYQRVFFGTVTNPKNEKLQDLTPREVLTFVPLLIMAFWIGLYPKPFFQILEQPVNQIVLNVRGPQTGEAVNAALRPAARHSVQPVVQTEMTAAPVATTASATNPSVVAQSAKGKN
jgi:NADH-quinone oxidoreductase subunit M